MRIRVAKAFNGYRVGQEFDWGDGMARVLIGRGMVVPADQPEFEGPERAVVEDRKIETAAIPKRKPRK